MFHDEDQAYIPALRTARREMEHSSKQEANKGQKKTGGNKPTKNDLPAAGLGANICCSFQDNTRTAPRQVGHNKYHS